MPIKLSRKLIFFIITMIIIVALLFTTIYIVLFSIGNTPPAAITVSSIATELSDDEINDIISNMSIEQKVGQMFIITPETFSNNSAVTAYSEINTKLIKQYNIGGFIMTSRNIITPNQITDLNNELKQFDNSLFICVNEEGGEISTIANVRSFPVQVFENMSSVGLNGTQQRAITIGDSIGQYLHQYGFNVNFAPNCDALLFSDKNIVANHSFGDDPKVVSKMTEGILEGLHNNGILGTAKHFPGYGNVSNDTFGGFPISYTTKSQLNDIEILPFKNIIKNDVDFIMTSNAIYPNLSNEDLPATLNKEIINILKQDLDYEGIIITGALNNGAISNRLQTNDDLLLPVLAGNDIMLMPEDFYRSYDALVDAVKTGKIPEERINESVFKILKAKSRAL